MKDRNTATEKGKPIGTPRRHPLPMVMAIGFPKLLLLVTVGLLDLGHSAWADAANVANDRHLFTESVKAVDASRVVRTQLTSQELAAPQPAMITLGLRNVAELDAKVQKGQIVSASEREARYYPTHEAWAAVADWALSQGLTVGPENSTHMSVMTGGQVSQVATAFQVQFARVRGNDGKEYNLRVLVHPSILERLRSEDADLLVRMEKSFGVKLAFRADPNYHLEHFKIINAVSGEEYR